MVAPSMNLVVLRLTICGVQRKIVLYKASNLSHNHPLSSLLTVVDGRAVVKIEGALTAEEYQTIKEQSLSRVHVPQMHVNLDDLFPSCSFSCSMLYQMRDKFLKAKYGADGHNLAD